MQTPNWLIDAWTRELVGILEMMTGESFSADWSKTGDVPLDRANWWRQGFNLANGAEVYVGASTFAMHEIGTKLLQAAGIDSVDEESAQSTFSELLQQSTSGLARAIGAETGKTVECTTSGGCSLPADATLIFLALTSGGEPLPTLVLAFSTVLTSAVSSPPAAAEPKAMAAAAGAGAGATTAVTAAPAVAPAIPQPPIRNMDVLLDVEMPVSLYFGQAVLPVRDVLKLTNGSIVELNRHPEEPVEVVVNNRVIARGEVVIVDGNYGVRINEIISRQQRLGLHPDRITKH